MTIELIADFVVTTRNERDVKLDHALSIATAASADDKLGILVTRHDYRRFSVSLTASVPFGIIQELDHAS